MRAELLFVAISLIAACRDGRVKVRDDAGPRGSASNVSESVVPSLPKSDDGFAYLRSLDRTIDTTYGQPMRSAQMLLERTSYTGAIEDYTRALSLTEDLVKERAHDAETWRLRAQALSTVHELADARAALDIYAGLVHVSFTLEPRASLASATGNVDEALKLRAEIIKDAPNAGNLTMYALELANAGRFDEAIALIPRAAAAAQRINTPQGTGWLYFQWGRIYELAGQMATAREFYEASNARMPGVVDTIEHLAAMLVATSNKDKARDLVREALLTNGHPTLQGLGVELGVNENKYLASQEWERYVSRLPKAFSDHAARFFLGPGADPKRALELARVNLENRATPQARILAMDAAIAAKDGAAACAVADNVAAGASKAERFAAWKSFDLCGRKAEAERLAKELGI